LRPDPILDSRAPRFGRAARRNQDADAIGGSVNLVTKTPGERPTLSFSGQGGYTPIQNGRWLNAFTGTIGRRFGSSKKFGALLGGTYDYNGRGIDDLEPGQAIGNLNGQNIAIINTEDLRTPASGSQHLEPGIYL